MFFFAGSQDEGSQAREGQARGSRAGEGRERKGREGRRVDGAKFSMVLGEQGLGGGCTGRKRVKRQDSEILTAGFANPFSASSFPCIFLTGIRTF